VIRPNSVILTFFLLNLDYRNKLIVMSVASRIERTGVDFYPTVIVNRSKVLHCDVIGVPKPVITWYKDGSALSLGGLSGLRSLDDGAKIEIDSANLNDTGMYECRAENEAGHDRVHYQLKVFGLYVLVVC